MDIITELNLLREADLKGELTDDEFRYMEQLEKKLISQSKAKQVIIVNRNLNMPQGKLASQVSHASLGALLQLSNRNQQEIRILLNPRTAVEEWLNGAFTKIVLYVKSENKLVDIYNKALSKKLPCVLIEDAGHTVFDKPTKTCVGIGPVYPEQLVGITDKLRVL